MIRRSGHHLVEDVEGPEGKQGIYYKATPVPPRLDGDMEQEEPGHCIQPKDQKLGWVGVGCDENTAGPELAPKSPALPPSWPHS